MHSLLLSRWECIQDLGKPISCNCLKVAAVVEVTAEAVIAAENRVECSRDARALDLKLGNTKALTVLGNIVGGPIMVNGAALGAPCNRSTSSKLNENLNAIWRSHHEHR